MTRSLSIPPNQQTALRVVGTLPETTFEALVEALGRPTAAVDRDELVARVVAASDIARDDASALVTALLQAYGVKSELDVEAEAVAAMVADAVLEPGASEAATFTGRMARLLELAELRRISKALYMLVEHERVYHGARIITDIRAVFPENVDDGPEGAVLVHILKLDYHDEDGEKSFFVGLDTEDVADLRRVLDRADTKVARLRSLWRTTSLPMLEVGKGDT